MYIIYIYIYTLVYHTIQVFVYCSDVGGGLDSTLWIQVRLATSNSPFCRGQQLGTALSAPTIHQSWSLLQAGVEVVNTCQARET